MSVLWHAILGMDRNGPIGFLREATFTVDLTACPPIQRQRKARPHTRAAQEIFRPARQPECDVFLAKQNRVVRKDRPGAMARVAVLIALMRV